MISFDKMTEKSENGGTAEHKFFIQDYHLFFILDFFNQHILINVSYKMMIVCDYRFSLHITINYGGLLSWKIRIYM